MGASDVAVFLEWLRSLNPSQALFLTGLLLVVLGAIGATGKVKGVSFAAGLRSLFIGLGFVAIGAFFLAFVPFVRLVLAEDDIPPPTPAVVVLPPTPTPATSKPVLDPKTSDPKTAPSVTRTPLVTMATTPSQTFHGIWQTMDGGLTQISQSGSLVELQGSATNGVGYVGRGQADGRYATLDFANSVGVRGRLLLELVSNGSSINGQLQTLAGTMPFQMVRRG